jgi:hypothetical protein
MAVIGGIWQSVVTVIAYTWWFWLPIILWPMFEGTWLFWRQEVFKSEIPFVLLELHMPRAVTKSPMSMEQVFAAIHALKNAPGDLREKWYDGEITRWYSFELVSLGGEVHFYLRCPKNQVGLIQAAFYSYYPDLEVSEVAEDYVNKFPDNEAALEKSSYDMWGSELILARDPVYPIRSYLDFESPEEEKQYDPMSLFLEVLGKLKREEIVGIQINAFPIGDHLREHGEHVIEKIRNKKQHHAGSASMKMEFPHILPVFPTEAHEGHQDNEVARALSRTPGETDVLKAIEENLAKPTFEVCIRFIYLSPKEIFTDTFPRRGLLGAFNQYGAMDLNYFKRNEDMSTRTRIWNWPHIFVEARGKLRKDRLLFAYRHREISPQTDMGKVLMSKLLNWENSKEFPMSTRSLATLFHPPTHLTLTAPHVRRVESRKAGPPAGLPIYGGEEEIEKFQ